MWIRGLPPQGLDWTPITTRPTLWLQQFLIHLADTLLLWRRAVPEATIEAREPAPEQAPQAPRHLPVRQAPRHLPVRRPPVPQRARLPDQAQILPHEWQARETIRRVRRWHVLCVIDVSKGQDKNDSLMLKGALVIDSRIRIRSKQHSQAEPLGLWRPLLDCKQHLLEFTMTQPMTSC